MSDKKPFYVTTKESNGFIVIEIRDIGTGSIRKTYTNSGKLIVPPSVSGDSIFYTYKNGNVTKAVNRNVYTNGLTETLLS